MIGNKVNLSLGLGDYSYGNANEFEPVVDALKKAGIPMKGTEGNHDHDSSSYAELFEEPSMLYAFNAGPARIVILNTEDSPSSNGAFLEKELKKTTIPWKIVAMHNPLYTSPSKHGEEKDQARVLQPLFDRYNVDLVMLGHNHNYERIKFPNELTLFIQSGTGGESHYKITGQRSGGGVQYQNDDDFGIGNSLTGQFISFGGKILDTFNIKK
jgi:acid phosphatase